MDDEGVARGPSGYESPYFVNVPLKRYPHTFLIGRLDDPLMK